MKRKDSLLANYYYQKLPKAQNGLQFPTPYSNEFIDKYEQDYKNFYAPPRQYQGDDFFDVYYHHILPQFQTKIKNEIGPAWFYKKEMERGERSEEHTSELQSH